MIIPGSEEKAFVQSSHRDEELLPLDQGRVRIWHPFNFLLLTGRGPGYPTFDGRLAQWHCLMGGLGAPRKSRALRGGAWRQSARTRTCAPPLSYSQRHRQRSSGTQSLHVVWGEKKKKRHAARVLRLIIGVFFFVGSTSTRQRSALARSSASKPGHTMARSRSRFHALFAGNLLFVPTTVDCSSHPRSRAAL